MIAPGAQEHPIVRGIKDGDVWGPTDVYGVRLPLPGDSKPIILGQVVAGMKFDDSRPGWQEERSDDAGGVGKDLYRNERQAGADLHDDDGLGPRFREQGLRRLLVNATYWGLGWEDKIPAKTPVELVGEYKPCCSVSVVL